MIIVEHRKNTIDELKLVPLEHGVEVDLRLSHGEIVLAHDPFVKGEFFINWIQEFQHALLILNVKEEGLEEAILDQLHVCNITNYFFLDQAVPSIVKSIKRKHSVAARISEYESNKWLPGFAPAWIWVDCFSGNWDYLEQELEKISKLGIKSCIVSPELQGRSTPEELKSLKSIFGNHNFTPDAVCTKESSKWSS